MDWEDIYSLWRQLLEDYGCDAFCNHVFYIHVMDLADHGLESKRYLDWWPKNTIEERTKYAINANSIANKYYAMSNAGTKTTVKALWDNRGDAEAWAAIFIQAFIKDRDDCSDSCWAGRQRQLRSDIIMATQQTQYTVNWHHNSRLALPESIFNSLLVYNNCGPITVDTIIRSAVLDLVILANSWQLVCLTDERVNMSPILRRI